MAEENKDTKKVVDAELDDLLDSALHDMTKKPEPSLEGASGGSEMKVWSDDFVKLAAAQFESNMAALMGSLGGESEEQLSQEQIAQTFSKMAEAAAQVFKTGETADATDPPLSEPENREKLDEVTAAISQTLQNLNTNAENLQTPFSEQDLANMFNNFNMGEGQQDGNMFVPFMQGMMQSLLSKEVLYPSLKELVDKYPAWLEENRGKIDQAEFDRFTKQKELMDKVCVELEPEQDSDPEDVKKKRFENVLELMQKMQDLGQPPSDLVGDLGSAPVGFAPNASADDSQCSIM